MSDDKEIDRLIAAYLDGTLSEADREAFERCMREDPGAIERAAEAVRFDAQLSDAAHPDHLELFQQRRMVIDRASGRPVVLESIQRVGPVGMAGTPTQAQTGRRHGRWALPLTAILLAGLGIWWAVRGRDAGTGAGAAEVWSILPLKNPGFESPGLGEKPTTSPEIQDWQDKFTTPNAALGSLPQGEAHGGKQVALLAPGGHIKQLLFDQDGRAVIFTPGTRLRVTGWVKPFEPVSGRADIMHIALHFVDEENRQYVVTYRIEPVDGSGWRHFSQELTVPEQETFEPSYGYTTGEVTSVRGRQMLLSITNISAQMPLKIGFMLDDMQVELLPPAQDNKATR